ncbi:tRNA (adenosine(37)-N6)-threonylcarbamoyltransferase complex dimerization subunit type 1 TsaB [Candidatus Mycoplasma mahonii]|uniref:tRNA (adenosine(37)-N6)-threonylcarbamoyltransferase complex dimerization subunit type 1 TsaB n=1 Tax=Candidatus Mycoplasma mahonii TaxID=3004105 RepID=UPI0026EEBC5D|nr:tRNA (adenosine(37)-N6)-threonylcarbamoyltransferase complex dimerization subunit type 1 TsaB [Candidatus Mycoplasma mahonii]WKX02423.1 tRNA (adenosine(37)-N6)-threonylcarbamoyltransferase complex dimerization subunit type 1 TsaB [Candidatus Mycoplasma mahonii]
MKLLIDTSLKTLFMSIIDGGETLTFIKEMVKKKADRLPGAFSELLLKARIKTKDIKEIYVTNGPGSFMGVRTALTFVRTIAQINGTKIFVADTLSFISGGTKGTYYIDARSDKSYKGVLDSKMSITLISFRDDSVVDYNEIINKPNKYLDVFKERNVLEVKPNYIKSPRIGRE